MEESEGPWPKNSRGWLLLLILLTIDFIVYSWLLYGPAYDYYLKKERYIPSASSSYPYSISIVVFAPKYVSNFVEQTMLVEIINNDTKSIGACSRMSTGASMTGNSSILMITISPADPSAAVVIISAVKSDIKLSTIQQGSILPNYATIECIPPHGTVSAVFYILARHITSDVKLDVYLDDDPVPITFARDIILANSGKALLPALVGKMLLPPWQNVYLALFAIFTVKLVEDVKKRKKSSKNKGDGPGLYDGTAAIALHLCLLSFVGLYLGGSSGWLYAILLLGLILGVFVAIIWWQERTKG